MNYQDAIDCDDLTKAEALAEIADHSLSAEDFLKEVGDKDFYTGAEVLGWLGY